MEFTDNTISGYIFYHSFSKYDNPIYLYSPHLFEGGGHRKGIESSYSLLHSGYRHGPIFIYHFITGHWSVTGVSRPSWSLDRDTMETTLSDQFFTFNSINKLNHVNLS